MIADIERTFRHYGVDVTGLRGNRPVRCPAHDDTIPSCSVNLTKGVAQCFACDYRGDAIALIILKEGLDFASAKQFAETHSLLADGVAADDGRPGLSGQSRTGRGGRHSRVRRRPGLAGA